MVLGIDPPRVHDLATLYALRTKTEAPPAEIARLITSLQPFAVKDRYPLLLARAVPRAEVKALVPAVAAEVESLAVHVFPKT